MPSLRPAQLLLAHAVLQVLRPQVLSLCSLLRTVSVLAHNVTLPAKVPASCSEPMVLIHPAKASTGTAWTSSRATQADVAGWCAGWTPRGRPFPRPPGSVVGASATAATAATVAHAVAAPAAGALGTAMGAVGAVAPAVSTVGPEAGPPPEAASPPRWLMKWRPRAGSEPAAAGLLLAGCEWPVLVSEPPPAVAVGSGSVHQGLQLAVGRAVRLYMRQEAICHNASIVLGSLSGAGWPQSLKRMPSQPGTRFKSVLMLAACTGLSWWVEMKFNSRCFAVWRWLEVVARICFWSRLVWAREDALLQWASGNILVGSI